MKTVHWKSTLFMYYVLLCHSRENGTRKINIMYILYVLLCHSRENGTWKINIIYILCTPLSFTWKRCKENEHYVYTMYSVIHVKTVQGKSTLCIYYVLCHSRENGTRKIKTMSSVKTVHRNIRTIIFSRCTSECIISQNRLICSSFVPSEP